MKIQLMRARLATLVVSMCFLVSLRMPQLCHVSAMYIHCALLPLCTRLIVWLTRYC